MTTKKIERELPIKLTEDGQEGRGHELAMLINERCAIDTALAEFTTGKRKRLREIKKREKELAAAIEGGVELGMVQCEEEMVFSTNTVNVMRLDTREIVERRPMTADERQTSIDVGAKTERRRVKGVKADAEETQH